jgi:hypothetical protein
MLFPSASSLSNSTFHSDDDDWDGDCEMENDEEPFPPFRDDATQGFEQWRWHQMKSYSFAELGSPRTDCSIEDEKSTNSFVSPTGPAEELDCVMDLNNDLLSHDRFLVPHLSLDEDAMLFGTSVSSLPFEKRFAATAKNLAESIRRSQETRKSLVLEIPEMSKYERNHSLSGVLKSVENSTHQVEAYLARAGNSSITATSNRSSSIFEDVI